LGNPTLEKGNIGKFLSKIAGDKRLNEREVIDVSALLFQKIHALVLSHNARLLVVLSPYKDDLTQKCDALKLLERSFSTIKLDGLSYIDYIETLKKNQKELNNIYLDEGHFTKKGNMLLAETVYKYLQKELNLN
jgi:lysophospholipase L1-like esterase